MSLSAERDAPDEVTASAGQRQWRCWQTGCSWLSGARSAGQHGRTVIVASVMVACVAIFTAWYVISHDYSETDRAAIRANNTLALALDEHVTRSLEPAVLALQRVADRIENREISQWAAEGSEWAFAQKIANELPQVSALSVADADGVIRLITTDRSAPQLNVGDREYFKAHQDGQSMFLTPTFVARFNGKAIFLLSMRLSDRNGQFRGVAIASMEIAYFRAFYRSLGLGPDSSVALFRDDGKPLLREPLSESFMSRDLGDSDMFQALRRDGPRASVVQISPPSAEKRLVASRRTERFPIVVMVTQSMDQLHRPVSHRAGAALVILFCVLAVLAGYTVLQLKAIARERSAHNALVDSRNFADAILDSMTSQIAILDGAGRIVRTNRAWEQMGAENRAAPGADSTSNDYLARCKAAADRGNEYASRAVTGMNAVLQDRATHFEMEYPCDSPDEPRWLRMRVNPLRETQHGVVVVHEDLSALKRVEQELRDLALADPLTGLRNRRAFFEAAEREFALARRHDSQLALIMLDCDRFKRINDTYGHGIGDQVLVTLANTLRATVRETDQLCRLGGEEFVVLAPQTTREGAFHLAERLREAISRAETHTPRGSLWFTVSLGVSMMSPGTGSLTELLQSADAAMYRAKQDGRNRTVLADS